MICKYSDDLLNAFRMSSRSLDVSYELSISSVPKYGVCSLFF